MAHKLDLAKSVLEDQREQLCERLFRATQGQADARMRAALLDMKRSVFNSRATVSAGLAEKLADSLTSDPTLLQDLAAWNDLVQRHEQAWASGEDAVRVDWQQVEKGVGCLWSQAAVQTGILIAQPQLYRQLASVSALDGGGGRKRGWKTAIAYCYRMATKTSPFSTFTATGAARLLRGSDRVAVLKSARYRSSCALGAGLVEKLANVARSNNEIKPELPVYLNDTIQLGSEEVYFLVARSKVPGKAREVGSEEWFVSLRRSALIDLILRLVPPVPESMTLSSLAARLTQGTAGVEVSYRRVSALLDKLVACGLLSLSLDYDASDPRALQSLGESPSLCRTDFGRALRAEVAKTENLVRGLEGQDAAAQSKTLSAIRERLTRLFAFSDATEPAIEERGLARHDCYLEGEVHLSSDALAPLDASVSRVTRVMPLFNTEASYQDDVHAFCRERCGEAPVNTVALYRDFSGSRPQLADSTKEMDDGIRIRERNRGRLGSITESFSALIDELRAEATRPGRTEGALSIDLLNRYGNLADASRLKTAPVSVGYLAQLWQEPTDPLSLHLVINRVVPGFGSLVARFTRDGQPGSLLSTTRRKVQATIRNVSREAEAVELVGALHVDGQITARITPRRLLYPGEASRLSREDHIPWCDTAVAFDSSRGCPRLLDLSTDKWILPISVGSLAPALLPPFQRFVAAFGPSLVPELSLVDHFEEHPEVDRSGEVRHYSRLTHGGVVLMRETWCIPLSCLPGWSKSESTFARFVRLRHWAHNLGLPRRVFVTPLRVRQIWRGAGSGGFSRLHKPFFVDWDELVSHMHFWRFTRGAAESLTVSEMLPLPEQLLLRRDGRGHVSECLFEAYQRV